MTIYIGNRPFEVDVAEGLIKVNGRQIDIDHVRFEEDGLLTFTVDGRAGRLTVDEDADGIRATMRGRQFPVVVESERDRLLKLASAGSSNVRRHEEIHATMPGMVVRLLVRPGSEVKRGQPILILEAMKMENEIRCPKDGVVREVHVKERQVVEKGGLLVVLD